MFDWRHWFLGIMTFTIAGIILFFIFLSIKECESGSVAYQYGDPDKKEWVLPRTGTLTVSIHVNPGFRRRNVYNVNIFYCGGTITVTTSEGELK